jgi:hypothetical protein
MKLRVQCYAGRKEDERPVRFQLGERDYMIEEIVISGIVPTMRSSKFPRTMAISISSSVLWVAKLSRMTWTSRSTGCVPTTSSKNATNSWLVWRAAVWPMNGPRARALARAALNAREDSGYAGRLRDACHSEWHS